jgi:rubrerythrin
MSEVSNPILGYADSYRLMARRADAEGKPRTVEMFSVITDLERNIAPLFASAQSELAALREELAIATRHLDRMIEHGDDLQQRLATDEQRNVVQRGLLRRALNVIRGMRYDELEAAIIEELNIPTESGSIE